MAANDILLAGDIGGTKTALSLYDASGRSLGQRTVQNADYHNFDDLLGEFLAHQESAPCCACIGVAGPVIDQAVTLTNLAWSLEAGQLADRHRLRRVWLINDLVATAMGVTRLLPTDLHSLNTGIPRPGAVRAVLAPGTGLGEAFLIPGAVGEEPLPTEGGHASFAPRNREQLDLLAWMLEHQEHVAVEQVCSGLALPTLFDFMARCCPPPTWLADELAAADDRTPVIVRAALQDLAGELGCEIAVRTLRMFVDILADEAANLVLKTLACGGLFIGGGLALRVLPFLRADSFMAVFARGTYQQLLGNVPVQVVLNPETALLGAAAYARSRCE
ncbi:MAG: glucokinase [Desulfobulbus sp.]|jgi:glucokinase|nr:glucokinase [Desulfobulbus sp.]